MAELADWFNRMPFFTRYWFGASVAVPLLCRLGIFSPYSVLLTPDFIAKMHLWKPLTAVFYYPLTGNKGFHYLVNLYFLYSYSTRLETGHFGPSPADFAFMLMFMWSALIIISYAFGIFMLMDPAVMSILYVYCILNQDQIVSFWFGTQFKARYLPWVLFGMNFIMGGGGMSELAGIIVGHLYWFVMMKYPEENGVQLIQTPGFLRTYFPSDLNNVAPRPTATATRPAAAAPGTAPAAARSDMSHNWGRGRRLED